MRIGQIKHMELYEKGYETIITSAASRFWSSNPAGRNEVCKSFLTFGFGDEPNRIT